MLVFGIARFLDMDPRDAEVISAAIQELCQQVDVVLFAPHWGSEMSYSATREQTELAHAAIDAGADIVCGSSIPELNNYQPTPYEEGSEGYQRVLDKLGLAKEN